MKSDISRHSGDIKTTAMLPQNHILSAYLKNYDAPLISIKPRKADYYVHEPKALRGAVRGKWAAFLGHLGRDIERLEPVSGPLVGMIKSLGNSHGCKRAA